MDSVLSTEVDNFCKSLQETAELIGLYGNDDLKDAKPFLDMFEECCRLKHDNRIKGEALEKAKDASSIEDCDRIYQHECQATKPPSFKKKSEYKEFQTRVTARLKREGLTADTTRASTSSAARSRYSNVDNDEMVVVAADNLYDPLTKQLIKDPVRNRICNHLYDRLSIVPSISVNTRQFCPVAGCGNRKYVSVDDLIDDPETLQRLMERNNQESEDPLA